MLKEWKFGEGQKPKKQCKEELAAKCRELTRLQLRIKQEKLPVIVLVEGWGAAGKGGILRSLIKDLDPRFFKVMSIEMPTHEERRWPFLKRYFSSIPQAGKFLFLNSGWMDETVRERLRGDLSDGEYAERIRSIRTFERQLAAGGYLLVKLFIHIDVMSQRERLLKLESDKDTSWRAEENDWRQNKNYDRTMDAFDDYLMETDTPWAPWRVIDGTGAVQSQLTAADFLCGQIRHALEHGIAVTPEMHHWQRKPMAPLADVRLDKTMEDAEYKKLLKKYRKRLADLHNELYRNQVPVVIVYEGWDAAGKGGNIKRLTSALDPRGYEVIPIASPTPEEKNRQYLWRFWLRLPKTGHIAVFDRSWYGRVMVERLEGFCSEEEWKRAYDEINEFEQELCNSGMVVIKFWVQIDKDTQLARFTERQNTPEKQWKITEEDWRNREKWDQYEAAVDEMLEKTSTESAPWHVLESVDKKYARIKAMKIVIEAIEAAL